MNSFHQDVARRKQEWSRHQEETNRLNAVPNTNRIVLLSCDHCDGTEYIGICNCGATVCCFCQRKKCEACDTTYCEVCYEDAEHEPCPKCEWPSCKNCFDFEVCASCGDNFCAMCIKVEERHCSDEQCDLTLCSSCIVLDHDTDHRKFYPYVRDDTQMCITECFARVR